MKQKIIVLGIIMIISVVFSRCQKDDDSSSQAKSKLQTVTIDEAKNLLTNTKTNSFGKSVNNKFENLEFDKISQEKINGTNELLTVIPFSTNSNLQNDRVLLLKVDNEIKSVVFTMYPDKDSVKGRFSGKLFSYSLDGNFISGFRAKDGIIISYFVEHNTVKSTTAKAIPLDEVVVQNNFRLVYALDMFGYSSLFGNDIYGGGYGGGDYYSWDASGGGGSESDNNLTTFNIIASGPKIDPKIENKCFDVSQSAELTIYVQQGMEGSRQLVGPNEVGHVFVGIKQNGIERYYGFYPESNANTAAVTVGVSYNSELRNNSGELYHVSISKSISAIQLSSIVNYANNRPSTYNVNDYACTDFGIAIGKLGGINLPSTKVSSFMFNGTSPGNLGEDIKSGIFLNTTKTTKKTYAPSRKGDCK